MTNRIFQSLPLICVLGFFLGLLFIGMSFLNGMDNSSHLLLTAQGEPYLKIVNPYTYNLSAQGALLTLVALVSGAAFFYILIPSRAAHNRRREATHDEGSPVNQLQANLNHAEVSAGNPMAAEREQHPTQQNAHYAAADGGEAIAERNDSSNDVIYSDGPITSSSMRSFLQNFPDSALKFLFQRNFGNKILENEVTELHQRWEQRGLRRDFLRELVIKELGGRDIHPDEMYDISQLLKQKYSGVSV